MSNADETSRARTKSTLWRVVWSIWPLVVAVAMAAALYALIRPRVTYVCAGESPRPCSCYRQGEEPANFAYDRISQGPAAGVTMTMLAMLLVGGFSIVLPGLARRSEGLVDRNFKVPRATKVLPIIGAAMLMAALLVFVTKVNPAPCTDQGALAVACGS